MAAKTAEGLVKEDIKFFLDYIKAHPFMPVQKGFGDRAVDFLVCWMGLYIAIEAKAPGEKATSKQADFLRKVREAGGVGIVIDGLDLLAVEWDLICRSRSIKTPDICFMNGAALRKAIGAPIRRVFKDESSDYPRMQLSRSDSPISSDFTQTDSKSRRR